MYTSASETRCTQCNLCVQVCPVNVFDAVPMQRKRATDMSFKLLG